MQLLKKRNTYIILSLFLMIFLAVYIFSDRPLYFGQIKIEDKQFANGNHLISFHKIEGGKIKEADLEGVSFYKNEEEVSAEYALSKIEVGNTYQVSLLEDKFPYFIFKNEIETFYMD